jgi:hypothetical protein
MIDRPQRARPGVLHARIRPLTGNLVDRLLEEDCTPAGISLARCTGRNSFVIRPRS